MTSNHLKWAKSETKWGDLCQGILKWSQEAIKEVGLINVLSGWTMNLWTEPNYEYSRDSSETPATCKLNGLLLSDGLNSV